MAPIDDKPTRLRRSTRTEMWLYATKRGERPRSLAVR
jgi:hypothetical protein